MKLLPFLPAVLVLTAALCGVTPAWAGKSKRAGILVPFTPMQNHGGPLVQVRLNDKETATFLIDTGASDCIISDTLAQKLGLAQLPARDRFGDEFQTEEGRLMKFVTVSKLQLGGAVLKDGAFLVTDHRDLFQLPEQGLDGLIGATLLSQFAVLVDGPAHRLALISPGGLSDDEIKGMGFGSAPVLKLKPVNYLFTDAFSREASFLVSLDLRSGDKKKREDLVVDTGAGSTSISYDAAKTLGLTAFDKQNDSTLYGSYISDISRVETVGLGSLALSNLPVSSPSGNDRVIPPLLGEDVLANCVSIFDFPKNKLYLKPLLPPLAPLPGPLDTARIDQPRLRADAQVPFAEYEKAWGSAASRDPVDVPARIAALQKGMKGDSADAEAYGKLGDLYGGDHQPDKAREAFAKAADLYRAQSQAAPKDAGVQARQAEALSGAGWEDAAETAARQATTTGPQNPKTWIALGRVLHARSLLLLTGRNQTVDVSENFVDYQTLITRLEQNRPSPDMLAQAQALSAQARTAFDKAVAVAPEDPAVYQARADFLLDRGLGLAAPQRELRGERFNVSREMFTDDYFADLEQVARLKTDDPEALRDGALADADIPVERSESGLDERESRFFGSLPRKYRQAAQVKIDRLALLGRSADKAKAAPALEALGEVQEDVLRDDALAEATLRQCLALDSGRSRAVYVLARLLTDSRRYANLTALLTDQIAKNDTVLNRVLLARTLDKQGRFAEAETQAEAARKLRPDEYVTNVTLAALRLRRSGGDDKALDQAGEFLAAAAKAMGVHPGRAQSAQYATLDSIYLALSGDPDAAAAQTVDVLRDNRTNTRARDVLAALVL